MLWGPDGQSCRSKLITGEDVKQFERTGGASLKSSSGQSCLPKMMKDIINNTPNLDLKETFVDAIKVKDGCVSGVVTEHGKRFWQRRSLWQPGLIYHRAF